jgi:hypothetical protein
MAEIHRTRRRLLRALLPFFVFLAAARSDAATLDMSWSAPTTNADGTPLTDLASYRIYIGSTTPTCTESGYRSVASPTNSPGAGTIMSYALTGLTAGTSYSVRVSAVDESGNESLCSSAASGVARATFTVSPTGSIAFGNVAVGSFADRTVVIQNVSSGTLSGAASATSPFAIVSGGSFSVSPGASHNVVVRFRPTTVGTVAANLTLTGGGDSISASVTGTGTTVAAPTVTVNRTGSGTVTSTPAGIACGSTCSFTVPAGSQVTLAAAAASGSQFSGWTGPCTGTGSCSVTVNGDVTIGATFAAITYPAPTLSTLAPASTAAGSTGFTLTLTGSNFVPVSVVRWNGSARTTTFVSATQLHATIAADDVATAGTAQVTVVTPSPGGGTSASRAFEITAAPNPVPALGTLSPAATVAGSPGFTLTVNGSSFVSASVVRWNGSPRPTTLVSPTQLRAAIAAADVVTAGTAQVTVFTSSPGGGTSTSQAFAITTPDSGGSSGESTEIIVDNAGPGVEDGSRRFTGRWCASAGPDRYGPDSLHACGSRRDTYRWIPRIAAAGVYDVYVWFTTGSNRSTEVPVMVVHADGKTTRRFDQTSGGGRWVLHGRYRFKAGSRGYVEVSDRNGPAGADAIRLVPTAASQP